MRASFFLTWLLLLLLLSYHSIFPCKANQVSNLHKLIESRSSANSPWPEPWTESTIVNELSSRVYVETEKPGSMEDDKIEALPGQPEGVNFDQYAGYVNVDSVAGRELFYYFVESPHNPSSKPLLLWLNGGPGCSSLGYGAMQELGPFRVNKDGKTLSRNKFSWNEVANVIFLESPTGVGFSYSSNVSDYNNGDKRTARDSYTFLLNWLERFPQYKSRNFYITGESYAGHYAPQLAHTILSGNRIKNRTVINLQGIAIGNAWLHDSLGVQGMFDYFWSRALNSDETNARIHKYCDFTLGNFSKACNEYMYQGYAEIGEIDIYNIYAPICNESDLKHSSSGSVGFDPCSEIYVKNYLNHADVQRALNVKATRWEACSNLQWGDSPDTILPTLTQLIKSRISILIYSGDVDGRVPVTSSKYFIKALKVPAETAWRPWYSSGQVGGYVEGYKGVTFATVRGAGHTVPSYQPERVLTMITAFLQRKLPPSKQ